ncbi:MAG: APC family permease [Candidatus Dependentiae bacterium]|nr:APC family permease [Candidatus Dependentiae bacterium]
MSNDNNTKISLATATIIGMNAMIGSGIFTAPATMAAYVGPAGIIAYILVVIAIWFLAQSLARLAELFPEEGSFYLYTKQWGGHTMGMIAITAYFIGLLIAMGLLSQMAGIYLHRFFPAFTPYTLGIIALWTLVILNMFGVALSSLGQHILIVCTLFPLIATTIMCFTKANLSYLTPFAPYGFSNVLKATRIVIFGFFGFECATSLFSIVKDPAKNVPRALTYSILIVGTIYTLFVSSIIISTPLSLFTNARLPLSEALLVIFPDKPWLILTIHFAILSAIIGTIHSMIMASSHLLMFLVKTLKNNVARKLIATGSFTTKTAVASVGLGIFITYVSFRNINLFFDLTSIFLIFAFIMSMITLLTIRSEWQSGRNITCILGILTALMIFTFAVQGLIHELGAVTNSCSN